MAMQKARTPEQHVDQLMGVIRTLTRLVVFLLGMLLLFPVIWYYGDDIAALWQSATGPKPVIQADVPEEDNYWKAPDLSSITVADEKELVAYGKDLIVHTAKYLGPRGEVAQISNGMNCQNCHLDAGTKTFGNNYSAVASTYPKFRARSGA
jgi:thiosulfate dehydrogenase